MSPKNERQVRIDYSRKFLKQLRKSPAEVKIALAQRSKLFLSSPFHPLLNNHSLTGIYSGKRSINITGDWRAINYEYKTDDEGTVVVFYLLGTHSQLYR